MALRGLFFALKHLGWGWIVQTLPRLYISVLQRTTNEGCTTSEGVFPHKGRINKELTKAILTTKLKNIRLKYRKAVDSGRRSGHGRVVLLYYELCDKIWGGSPATEQIEGGLETSDITDVDPPSNSPQY